MTPANSHKLANPPKVQRIKSIDEELSNTGGVESEP